MVITKIKKYRGVNILILNEWHKFVYILFYKGKFYANTFDIKKTGEYTEMELIRALDVTLLAAKKTADIIIERSGIINKIKTYVNTIKISVFGRKRGEEEPKTTPL